MSLGSLLFPEPLRPVPGKRVWTIVLRTFHIGAFGTLLGGHTFGVEWSRLIPWLWFALGTGAALLLIECYQSCQWLAQGQGLAVLGKLALLLLVIPFWEQRVPILWTVVVIGSVGAHMPARFRYYSVVHRRVLEEE